MQIAAISHQLHDLLYLQLLHAASVDDVHQRELQERAEHVRQARDHPDVQRLDVGDVGQPGIDHGALRGHREDGKKSQADPGRDCLVVDPEITPR